MHRVSYSRIDILPKHNPRLGLFSFIKNAVKKPAFNLLLIFNLLLLIVSPLFVLPQPVSATPNPVLNVTFPTETLIG